MSQIIEPERHGMWIAASFIVALIGVVFALIAFNRANTALVGLQTEILLLNKKVEDIKKTIPPMTPPVAQSPATANK